MKKNVGGVDRIFRIGVGFLSLAIFFATEDVWLKVIFGVVAVAGLLTAATGYCPINDKMKINTAEKK
ncbi:MAG: DUF2892 domain-containing protein [Nitrospirota bacterium]